MGHYGSLAYGTLATLAIALAFSLYVSANSEVVITRTEHGFEPREVRIQKGDTVKFVSEIEKDFWPASNAHPTHAVYSDFDPEHSLARGSSWVFTFNRVGTWNFHDHLDPKIQGTIFVEGNTTQTPEDCLKASKSTIQPECWEGELRSVLVESGLSSVFNRVRELYDTNPEFRRNCHDVMHFVGQSAYNEFLENTPPVDRNDASLCGFGFYHGFMESMLVEKGSGNYDDALRYCGALEIPNAKPRMGNGVGQCYHGIGHALFDLLPGELWGDGQRMMHAANKICISLFSLDEKKLESCNSGVYNSLANAYSARAYNLAYEQLDPDPLAICQGEDALSQDSCFGEVLHGYIRDKQWDATTMIQYIEAISLELARESVWRAYAQTDVKRSIDAPNLQTFATLCERPRVRDSEACVVGVQSGLATLGEPGRQRDAIDAFCNIIPDSNLREFCITYANKYHRKP
jgi:plastocyanin